MFPMVRWFELITITILWSSCKYFCDVKFLKALNIGVSCAFILVLFLRRRESGHLDLAKIKKTKIPFYNYKKKIYARCLLCWYWEYLPCHLPPSLVLFIIALICNCYTGIFNPPLLPTKWVKVSMKMVPSTSCMCHNCTQLTPINLVQYVHTDYEDIQRLNIWCRCYLFSDL